MGGSQVEKCSFFFFSCDFFMEYLLFGFEFPCGIDLIWFFHRSIFKGCLEFEVNVM